MRPNKYDQNTQIQEFPEIPFNKYKLVRTIGKGAFSKVYLAFTPEYQRRAIKRITLTSRPNMILKEIEYLKKMRGRSNVVQLKEVLFSTDIFQTSLVTTFLPSDDFKATLPMYTPLTIAHYMKSLLTSLTHLDRYHLLHRDVKPGNFLYCMSTGEGILIDFGLAQTQDEAERFSKERDTVGVGRGVVGRAKELRNDKRNNNICGIPDMSLAYLRPLPPQPHSGTHGYRAPEILAPVDVQTTKIDVWSAGCCLSQLLTSKTGLFRGEPPTDAHELLAQRAIIGHNSFAKGMAAIGADFLLSGGTHPQHIPWEEATLYHNPTLFRTLIQDGGLAFDLIRRLLEFDPKKRLSAGEALQHPFIKNKEKGKSLEDLIKTLSKHMNSKDAMKDKLPLNVVFAGNETLGKQEIMQRIRQYMVKLHMPPSELEEIESYVVACRNTKDIEGLLSADTSKLLDSLLSKEKDRRERSSPLSSLLGRLVGAPANYYCEVGPHGFVVAHPPIGSTERILLFRHPLVCSYGASMRSSCNINNSTYEDPQTDVFATCVRLSSFRRNCAKQVLEISLMNEELKRVEEKTRYEAERILEELKQQEVLESNIRKSSKTQLRQSQQATNSDGKTPRQGPDDNSVANDRDNKKPLPAISALPNSNKGEKPPENPKQQTTATTPTAPITKALKPIADNDSIHRCERTSNKFGFFTRIEHLLATKSVNEIRLRLRGKALKYTSRLNEIISEAWSLYNKKSGDFECIVMEFDKERANDLITAISPTVAVSSHRRSSSISAATSGGMGGGSGCIPSGADRSQARDVDESDSPSGYESQVDAQPVLQHQRVISSILADYESNQTLRRDVTKKLSECKRKAEPKLTLPVPLPKGTSEKLGKLLSDILIERCENLDGIIFTAGEEKEIANIASASTSRFSSVLVSALASPSTRDVVKMKEVVEGSGVKVPNHPDIFNKITREAEEYMERQRGERDAERRKIAIETKIKRVTKKCAKLAKLSQLFLGSSVGQKTMTLALIEAQAVLDNAINLAPDSGKLLAPPRPPDLCALLGLPELLPSTIVERSTSRNRPSRLLFDAAKLKEKYPTVARSIENTQELAEQAYVKRAWPILLTRLEEDASTALRVLSSYVNELEIRRGEQSREGSQTQQDQNSFELGSQVGSGQRGGRKGGNINDSKISGGSSGGGGVDSESQPSPQQHNMQLLQALAALQETQIADSAKGKETKPSEDFKSDSMVCALSKMNAALHSRGIEWSLKTPGRFKAGRTINLAGI